MLSKFTNKFKTYYDLHDIEEEKAKLKIFQQLEVKYSVHWYEK